MILKNTLLVLAATALGHLFNYLYHLVSARFLDQAQYGLLESFLALNYFLAVIISSFSLTIISQANPKNLKALQTLSWRLSLFTWLGLLLSYPLLNSLLKINQPQLFLIFSFQLLFSFVPTFYLGLIQAKLNFKAFSLINLLSPLSKLITLCLLFYLGLKLNGALASLVVSGLVVALASYLLAKPLLNFKTKSVVNLKPFWSFSALTFFTQLGLTSLYASDILLVRFFFSPDATGLYSAVSVIGKIIFFVSATVLTVAFPVFAKLKTQTKKLPQAYLHALLLITLICLSGLLIYHFFPGFILGLLYPAVYQAAAGLLSLFGIFMVLFTLLNLNLQFLLAQNRSLTAWLASFTAIFQITLIIFFHSSLNQVILNSILATALSLLFSFILVIRNIKCQN